MKIGALAPWYGSKRTLAPTIVGELGQHSCYWEIFCGSCSALFAKPRVTYETVNDLHGDLVNLALVVQQPSAAEDLYGRAARTLFHEDLLPVAKQKLTGELLPESPDVDRAYWYLVFSWMSLNGISGTPLNRTGTFAVRYSASGGNGATRWRSVVESIPDWHERLIGVQILRRDAFEILANIDDSPKTCIYVDPPYITKGAKYVHDFADEAEHRRLAELLARFAKARVVVSYYAHPLLEEIYAGWTVVACSVAKSMNVFRALRDVGRIDVVNSGMRDQKGRTEAPEILLVNGTSYTQNPTLF
jgi:DNA adenine methylase